MTDYAYYPLDGNADDAWGSNDGASNGGLSWSSDAIRGQSGDFDGSDDYIDIPDAAELDLGQFTVSGWVKLSSTSNETIACKRGGTSANRNYLLNVNSGEARLYHDNGLDLRGGSVPTGSWVFIAGTYDGNTARVYINGTQVASTTASSPPTNKGDLTLGRDGGGTAYASGHIDDVRIYDYALEPSEVHDLYQWGTRGKDLRKDLVTI